MNKLPKEIYVRIETESDGTTYMLPTETPDEHASLDETRVVGVYKLVSTVEVSTQIKHEVIVKKSPKKQTGVKVKGAEFEPESAPRNPLLDEMRVTA